MRVAISVNRNGESALPVRKRHALKTGTICIDDKSIVEAWRATYRKQALLLKIESPMASLTNLL